MCCWDRQRLIWPLQRLLQLYSGPSKLLVQVSCVFTKKIKTKQEDVPSSQQFSKHSLAMLQNTVAPTLFLATEHKLRAVRKASLQEFSGPPPLPETQAGHHPPVLKETEHRKKAKIEYFQTFCIMSCPWERCTWEMPWSVAGHKPPFFNWSVFSHCHRQTQTNKTMWGREEMHTTFFSKIPVIPQSSNLIIVYFASFTFYPPQHMLFFQSAFLHDQWVCFRSACITTVPLCPIAFSFRMDSSLPSYSDLVSSSLAPNLKIQMNMNYMSQQ